MQALALIGEFNNWDPKAEHWAIKNDFGVFQLFLPDNADGTPAIQHRCASCLASAEHVQSWRSAPDPRAVAALLPTCDVAPESTWLQDQGEGAAGDGVRRVGGAHPRLDPLGHPGAVADYDGALNRFKWGCGGRALLLSLGPLGHPSAGWLDWRA